VVEDARAREAAAPGGHTDTDVERQARAAEIAGELQQGLAIT
jgi:hypothetical protein